MKKYFKPKSLAWWASVAEAGLQVLRLAGVEVPKEADMIIASLFGIGMRGAVK